MSCYQDQLKSMQREHGSSSTLAAAEAWTKQNREFANQCHLAMHPVGEMVGRQAAMSGKPDARVANTSSPCRQGFAHGYILGFFADQPREASPSHFAQSVFQTCSEWGDKGASFQVSVTCVHAAGHVQARTHSKPEDAVAGCERIDLSKVRFIGDKPADGVSNSDFRDECLYGMNMEYSLIDARRGVEPNDPCPAMPVSARPNCYVFLPNRLNYLGASASDIGKTCSGLHNENYALVCGAKMTQVTGENKAACRRIATGAALKGCLAALDASAAADRQALRESRESKAMNPDMA
jgi:hypothetical protein